MELLIIEGFHVPTIPFGDVVLNSGATVPSHNGGIAAKFGAVCVFTVTLIVAVDAQELPVGVKV